MESSGKESGREEVSHEATHRATVSAKDSSRFSLFPKAGSGDRAMTKIPRNLQSEAKWTSRECV